MMIAKKMNSILFMMVGFISLFYWPNLTVALNLQETSIPSALSTVGRNEVETENRQIFTDETALRLPEVIDNSTDVELGDIDRDGDLDVVLANTDGGRNRLLINDGSGNFTDESGRLPFDSDFSLGIELGDVDGDGDLDIFVANNFAFQFPDCALVSGLNRLFINNGVGIYFDETARRLPVSIAASTDAKFLDIDGDSDLDIVVTNSIRPDECLFVGGGQIQLLVNDGFGVFTDETDSRLPLAFYSDVSVDFGDIDGDNDFDIIVANPYEQNRLLVNDGLGVFTDHSDAKLPNVVSSTRRAIFFDADGDEDLDIFFANDSSSVWSGQIGAQNRLLLNTGSGIFIDETDLRLPVANDVSRGGVACGDIDIDGDLDLIVVNNNTMFEGRQNSILINNGSGLFYDETGYRLPALSDISSDAQFGDIDGDGDHDVIIANYGQQNRLFLCEYGPKRNPEEPQVLKGDVNGDGGIDIMDVLATVNHILGLVSLTEEELDRADCNGDGQVDILDATGSINVILGIGDCSPGGCKVELTPEVFEFLKSLGEEYLSDEDFRQFMVDIKTGSTLPIEYTLSQNYPNPFNSSTRIDFQILASGMVNVAIFNALGQRIRTLVKSEYEKGFYTLQWDGRDDSGQDAPSGVYFYQLTTEYFSVTKKMILMR